MLHSKRYGFQNIKIGGVVWKITNKSCDENVILPYKHSFISLEKMFIRVVIVGDFKNAKELKNIYYFMDVIQYTIVFQTQKYFRIITKAAMKTNVILP